MAALTALYPLVTVLLAVGLLGERLSGVQIFGLILSLSAIWLFNVQTEGKLLSPTVGFAVLPIVLWGLSGFLQKLATNQLSAETAALLQNPLLAARLRGAFTSLDSANRVHSSPAERTQRFGTIAINRRMKYWVMDNVSLLVLNSIAFLVAGLFFLRYVRTHYFPPLPDSDVLSEPSAVADGSE